MNRESISIDKQRQRRFRRHVAILLIVVVSFLSLPTLCNSHSHDDHHDHHHHDENPSFKYSRQANDDLPPVQKQQHHHHHTHEHQQGHQHTTKKSPLGKFYKFPKFDIFSESDSSYLIDKVQETSMAGRSLTTVKHSDKKKRTLEHLFSLNNLLHLNFYSWIYTT